MTFTLYNINRFYIITKKRKMKMEIELRDNVCFVSFSK